jgi:hypothetical protein
VRIPPIPPRNRHPRPPDLCLRSHRSVSPTLLSAYSSHCTRRAAAAVLYTADGRRTSHGHPQTKPAARRMGAACGAASALSYRFSRSARPALRSRLPANPSRSQHANDAPGPQAAPAAHDTRPSRPGRKRGMRSRYSFETAAHEARQPERAPTMTSSRRGEGRRDAAGGGTASSSTQGTPQLAELRERLRPSFAKMERVGR